MHAGLSSGWRTARNAGDSYDTWLRRRLTVTGIQYCLARHCRQAGIWITCHQFRHTFGRHLVEARMPVTSIQRLLGHVRLRTTQTYLHISDRQVQADYEAAMVEITQRLSLEGSCR